MGDLLRELHPVAAGGLAMVAAPPFSAEGRWRQLREKWGRPSKSIEEILKLEGLAKVEPLKQLPFIYNGAEREREKERVRNCMH